MTTPTTGATAGTLATYFACVCHATGPLSIWPPGRTRIAKHLLVSGESQGGGQAIVTAALDPHVTAFAAGVPALWDHTAVAASRAPGWPRLVEVGADGKPNPGQLEVARYFDAVNFARLVKVPAIIGVGFADMTCPAFSVYAAHNALAGPKLMVIDPLAGHSDRRPIWWQESRPFLLAHGRD